MSKREKLGRALFLTRDSGGKHETTPAEYVQWAMKTAAALGVKFQATPEMMTQMIRDGRSIAGDIFLDYGVSGEKLSRTGLDAFISEALNDFSVSHVFIPRRDRLARPENPIDGAKLEISLREAGITVVFMDRVCQPILRGAKRDIGDLVTTIVDYSSSGDFVIDLAQKMIHAQIHLAKEGYSVGGRAPYGFRRHLVKADGTVVRQLTDGEYVKMAQHHVVWMPGPEEELAIINRIFDLLEKMPAGRVAAILTADRVPTPDSNRERTDGGVKHKTSGVWHQTTINNIARNRLLSGVMTYGKRSMGRLLRFSPEGPRLLNESEHLDEHRKKVVRNADADLILAKARFEPLIEQDRQKALMETLNLRGGTQRGKPRSRRPAENPLGGRIYDISCSWPMYRTPTGKSFCYKCGLYQQSHGAACQHNWIGGPAATKFALNSVRQRILAPDIFARLEKRLRQIAHHEQRSKDCESAGRKKKSELSQIKRQLELAARNMALAETDDQREAIKGVFDELRQKQTRLTQEFAELNTKDVNVTDLEAEIKLAMESLRRLAELAQDERNLSAVGELFKSMNVNLFLRFQSIKQGKRSLNKLAGGVMTLGSAPFPISPYQGPTAREAIGNAAKDCAETHGSMGPVSAQTKGKVGMLGNVNRGDRI